MIFKIFAFIVISCILYMLFNSVIMIMFLIADLIKGENSFNKHFGKLSFLEYFIFLMYSIFLTLPMLIKTVYELCEDE